MLDTLFRLLGDFICPQHRGSQLPKWPYDHIDAKDLEKHFKNRPL